MAENNSSSNVPATSDPSLLDECTEFVKENWKTITLSAAAGAAIGAAVTYFIMSDDDD